jgi:predicted nuclease of restriction endonuclease-like RecB superfamily
MLTADLAMSWRRGHRTGPRALDVRDDRLVRAASDLIAIVGEHIGRPRGELDHALEEYIGTGTDYRTLRGLVKLLMDRCEFETAGSIDPLELRREVFRRSAPFHPVPPEARDRLLEEASSALGGSLQDARTSLYADLASNQRLTSFDALDALGLLERYNVAQAQAVLYRSVRMMLRVEPQSAAGYRRLFDAIKAYRLIYTLAGDAARGYDVSLDGPVSIFHRSQKYGVQMAVFLPALLACEGWRMTAEIDVKPHGTAFYELESRTTRLRLSETYVAPTRHPLVDKLLEALLRIEGEWRAEASAEVVDLGETAFVPDAVARHSDGSEVHIEVLGFWTPRFLADRLECLAQSPSVCYLLIATEELFASRDPYTRSHPNVLVVKSSLDPRALGAALDRLRTVSPGKMS